MSPDKTNVYRIFETEQFQKDLGQIAKSGEKKIFNKLQTFVYPQLRMHPHYGPNIKKLKDFDPEIGKGQMDPTGLHTIISNLISNSAAACNENRVASNRHIRLAARLEDSSLTIEVSDNGKGMSDNVKQNLFKKFFSTKGAKGTGLGLLVTRKIVEENGGAICLRINARYRNQV